MSECDGGHCVDCYRCQTSGVGRCFDEGGPYIKGWVETEQEVRGVAECRTRMKIAPDASGKLASFSGEGRGSGALPRSRWRVHRCCGLSGLNLNITTLGRVFLKTELHAFTQAARSYCALVCVVPVVPMPLQTEILETMCTEYSLSILIFILNKKGRYHPSNLHKNVSLYQGLVTESRNL